MDFQELIKLIFKESIRGLKKAKKKGVDFLTTDKYDKNNILIAYCGYAYDLKFKPKDMIDFLLDCGLDVNHQMNKRGSQYSALHMAVEHDNYEIAKILLEKDANIEIQDSNGNTPLWKAVMNYRGKKESFDIIKLLLTNGASLDTKNFHDASPKDIIVQVGEGFDGGYNDKNWDLRTLLK